MRYAIAIALAGCWTGSVEEPKPVEPPKPVKVAPPPGQPAGTALVIERTPSSGVIQLAGERPIAMEAANLLMNDHCGPGQYVIVQEGEESIGPDASGRATKVEWRVHYQCASNP